MIDWEQELDLIGNENKKAPPAKKPITSKPPTGNLDIDDSNDQWGDLPTMGKSKTTTN